MKLHPLEDCGLIETTLNNCTLCKGILFCERCTRLFEVMSCRNGTDAVEVEDDILTRDTKENK